MLTLYANNWDTLELHDMTTYLSNVTLLLLNSLIDLFYQLHSRGSGRIWLDNVACSIVLILAYNLVRGVRAVNTTTVDILKMLQLNVVRVCSCATQTLKKLASHCYIIFITL